jgi:inner membrane protein
MGVMDSLSQIALGAAVTVAVMHRRTAVWKAALWGAVAGTLPDLDVLIDHGDPILDMVLHRAETHSLFWLALFSLPFAAAVARLQGEWAQWRAWWLALALALLTHPLLDAMTVYGTQLLLPFTDRPYGVGSIFIIDPLYTLPLLVGTGWALAARGGAAGWRANAAGLVLSTAYLAWGAAAQQHVAGVAAASLAQQGIRADRVLVTPTAFNTVLWRVVAVAGDSYHEGFHSLLDEPGPLHFDRFERGVALEAPLRDHTLTQHIRGFSGGFYHLRQSGDTLRVTDLRMGQEPTYTFSFTVARVGQAGTVQPLPRAESAGSRPDVPRALAWLWQRLLGHRLPPPR